MLDKQVQAEAERVRAAYAAELSGSRVALAKALGGGGGSNGGGGQPCADQVAAAEEAEEVG
eukprot:364848-Chlamydomonas_euryale.AAC.9